MNINGENASLFSSNFCHESYSCKLLESQIEELLYSFFASYATGNCLPLLSIYLSLSFFIFLNTLSQHSVFDISSSAPSFLHLFWYYAINFNSQHTLI